MHDFHGKTALVTGAASGIGRATAIAFAKAGASLVICDVDEPRLRETEAMVRALGRTVFAKRVDVASKDEMRELAEGVHRHHGALDVLVNNAGVGLGGGFLDTTLEDWSWIVGINLMGVVHGCHYFVPKMVERGRGGHVVNVSSAAGFTASEVLVAYCTTKYAVLGLSEAMRLELKKHHIGVTAICPGIINTPITKNTRLRGKSAQPGVQERVVAFYQKRNYGPEKVAERILDAVARDRAVVPVSPEAWAFYFMKRLSPALFERFSKKMGERLDKEVGR